MGPSATGARKGVVGCRPNGRAPKQLADMPAELQVTRNLSLPSSSGLSPAAWPGESDSPQRLQFFNEPVLIGKSTVTTWSTAPGTCASTCSG